MKLCMLFTVKGVITLRPGICDQINQIITIIPKIREYYIWGPKINPRKVKTANTELANNEGHLLLYILA